VAAGAPQVGAVRRTRGRRDSRDRESRPRPGECHGRLAAVVRSRGATARRTSRRMRPDASHTAYNGRLVSVTVETWGEHEREIVEHPGAVAIVAVDARDHVVLVRQLREPARTELLELPAGTLGDEEPLACARRELAEETGLHGGEWRHAASFWTTPGFCR